MKKIIVVILILAILLIPIKLTYYDGTSYEYQSLTYKYIVWNKKDLNYTSGYKTGKEFHFFPSNFKSMDYYDDIMPVPFLLTRENKTKEVLIIKSSSYDWCNDYDICVTHNDIISNNFDDYKLLNIRNGDKITYTYTGDIKEITIFDQYLNPTNENVDFTNSYINYLEIKGKRIVKLSIKSKYGKASYYYAIDIE